MRKIGEYPLLATVAAFTPLSPVVVAVVMIVIVVSRLIFAYERREKQYKALIASLREARTADAAVIKGLQEQVAELLENKADLYGSLKEKDSHIAGLVKEVAARQATIDQAFEEAWSLRQKAEELAKKNISLKKDRDKACEIADNLYRQ